MTDAPKRTPPAPLVAIVLAAAAMATPLIARFEGYRPTGYKDPAPAAYDTICYGHKQAGSAGKTVSDDECAALLAGDAVSHGLDISRCIPPDTPTSTRAAFTSFAFNVGTAKFCASTMAKKARARDWRGACAEFPKWIYAGGKTLPGLPPRREAERRLCERDL
jgi:lysozyme